MLAPEVILRILGNSAVTLITGLEGNAAIVKKVVVDPTT